MSIIALPDIISWLFCDGGLALYPPLHINVVIFQYAAQYRVPFNSSKKDFVVNNMGALMQEDVRFLLINV